MKRLKIKISKIFSRFVVVLLYSYVALVDIVDVLVQHN